MSKWRVSERSDPVIFLEIVGEGLGVGMVDRSTEGVTHFGDLGIPSGCIQERRVHRYVIEAMAGAAIRLDFIEPVPA